MAVRLTDIFDATYVLTCPKYTKDRLPLVIRQLRELGLDSVPVHTVITPKSELLHSTMKRHTWWWSGNEYVVYCAFGHLTAMNDMVCRGYKRSLILEDDVRFMNSREKFLKQLSSLAGDCDVAMLDWVANKPHKAAAAQVGAPEAEWLAPMCRFVSSAAYIVSEKGATCLMQKYNEAVGPCDSTGIVASDDILNGKHNEEFRLKTLLAAPVLARQYTVAGDGRGIGRLANRYNEQHSTCERYSEGDYKWPFQ